MASVETVNLTLSAGAKQLLSDVSDPKAARVAMLRAVGLRTQSVARRDFLSGPRSASRLGVVSGRLRRSVIVDERKLPRAVNVGSDVIYASVHEFGAIIKARSAPFLVFTPRGSKRLVRTQRVTIPARPFLAPAVEKVFPVEAEPLAEAAIRAFLR
ncbi:MAG TPA: phage virion morphogenesis protein [Thermoanaerobaculia bacterium]